MTDEHRQGRLAGKTALVTGATTGIGLATAQRFLAEGARVIVTGQDPARLDASVRNLGAGATGVVADVRSSAGLAAMADRARTEFGEGGLDVVFANAGVGKFAPVEAVDEAFWDEQFDVNVKGLFFTVKALLPLLAPRASVVLNASAVNAKGLPMGSVYFASKAAVRSLARTLAAELAPRGIRVNALSPGFVLTAFQGKMGLPPETLEGFGGMIRQATPLGRFGETEEIAAAALFLASAESSYVTGADLTADGGFMNV